MKAVLLILGSLSFSCYPARAGHNSLIFKMSMREKLTFVPTSAETDTVFFIFRFQIQPNQ
jgi:hypothetical protein